jgi:hypothetical protein
MTTEIAAESERQRIEREAIEAEQKRQQAEIDRQREELAAQQRAIDEAEQRRIAAAADSEMRRRREVEAAELAREQANPHQQGFDEDKEMALEQLGEVVPEYPGCQTLVDDIMIASGVDENTARNWIVFAADEIREDF